MKPITNAIPKPLIKIGKHSLIEYHLQKLALAGFRSVIINVSYLREKIMNYLGDGSSYGLKINYSIENEAPLGTAGGIAHARHFFNHSSILVVNGDVYSGIDYKRFFATDAPAHLILVDNPSHNVAGDFELVRDKVQQKQGNSSKSYTFSGIGIYQTSVFDFAVNHEKIELREIFEQLIASSSLSGQYEDSYWFDVGSPQRLCEVRAFQRDQVERQNI